MPKANLLTADEVHSLAAQFEYMSPEKILGWAWEQFGERGYVGSHEMGVPIETNRFQARIFWMGTKPLLLDKR